MTVAHTAICNGMSVRNYNNRQQKIQLDNAYVA